MVSGFTTTGASILTDVEALSRCNLFWRSFSHWLGGMGVLVFLLAVVPGARKNGGTGIYLMRAESPGPSVDKLTPHLRQTAMILYGIYILLTALCIVCLLLGGMPVFDSFCIAFGTAGTGGFAIKNSSMGGYSCFLQTVVTVFMFLFGVNFSLYYMLLLRKFKAVFKNEELRLYFGIAAGPSSHRHQYQPHVQYGLRGRAPRGVSGRQHHDHNGLRHGRFRAVAGVFQSNPAFAHVHRCQRRQHGRRSQGLPCFAPDKSIRRTIRKALHPRRVQPVYMDGRAVSEEVCDNVNAYLAIYCVILVLSFAIISVDGFSIGTNFSAVAPASTTSAPALSLSAPHKISAFTAISRRLSFRSICSSADSRFPSPAPPQPRHLEPQKITFCNKFARINCIKR